MRRERTGGGGGGGGGGEEDCSQRETGEAAAKSTHCGKQTRDPRQTAGPPVTHVCTRHRRPIYFCPRFRSGGNLISLWLSPFQTWRERTERNGQEEKERERERDGGDRGRERGKARERAEREEGGGERERERWGR